VPHILPFFAPLPGCHMGLLRVLGDRPTTCMKTLKH